MNDAISKNKTTPESKAFWGLAQKASDEIEKWPAWKKGESENNTACQYCNTPLTLAHQQQAHNEQPCRGSLLAEIAELKRTSYTIESLTAWFRKEIDDRQRHLEHAKAKALYLEAAKRQIEIEILEGLIDDLRSCRP